MVDEEQKADKFSVLQRAAVEALNVLKRAEPGYRRNAKEILMRALAISKKERAA